MVARLPLLETWEDAVAEAAELIGPDHRGGRRLLETKEFFRFTREETLAMVDRWKRAPPHPVLDTTSVRLPRRMGRVIDTLSV